MRRNKMEFRGFVCLFFGGVLLGLPEAVTASDARASLSVNISTERDKGREQNTKQTKTASAATTTTVDKETQTCTLEIEVENRAEQTGNYAVEWCVIAKRTSGKAQDNLVVSDSGKIEITREGKATGTETVKPKAFVFTTTSINYGDYSSNQTREGDVYAGYVVLVKADGEIIAKASNDDRFSKDEWVAQCEKAVQAKAKTKAVPKKEK